MKTPSPLANVFAILENERRSGLPDEKCGFFDSNLVRMAMAWARAKGFEEAAAVVRSDLAGPRADELARLLEARRGTPPLVNVRQHAEVQ